MNALVRFHVAGAVISALAITAGAQAPGLPLLQGAFPAPGLAAGINVGHGDGRTAALLAVGIGPRNGRLHLDLGGGVLTGDRPGFKSTPATYGGRIAVRVATFASERIAVTPFFGFGSTRSRISNSATAGLPVVVGDSGRTLETDVIPVGASIGGRFAVGASSAVAVSVAPYYAWYRQTGIATEETRGRVRAAGVVELALGDRFGIVAGVEAGQTSADGRPGPGGTTFAGGVSYALRRR